MAGAWATTAVCTGAGATMTPGAATANAKTDNTNNCNNTRRTNKEMLWLVLTHLAPIGTYTSLQDT